MRTVRKSVHNAYQIHYHFVFPVKYREKIFQQKDREQTLVQICGEIEKRYEYEFEQIGLDGNHVHYLLSAAPKYAPSEIARVVKSLTAWEMLTRHPDLREELWGGELWTDGFFVATVGEGGNVNVIREYVRKQGQHDQVKQLKHFDFRR
jgi:putative transposase